MGAASAEIVALMQGHPVEWELFQQLHPPIGMETILCVCVCEKKTHHRLFLVLIFIWTIKIFKSTYIRIFMNIMMKTLMYIVFSFVILLFINKSCTYNFHFLDFFLSYFFVIYFFVQMHFIKFFYFLLLSGWFEGPAFSKGWLPSKLFMCALFKCVNKFWFEFIAMTSFW